MEGFRIDLKTFLAWLCLTSTLKLSENKYQACFGVPKSPNLHNPYIIVLLYYNCDRIYENQT